MSIRDEVHYEAEERHNRKLAIAEWIENDLRELREIVGAEIGMTDPCSDEDWTADLLIALRESKPILNAICGGMTLEQAMYAVPGIDHFRTLLRCADDADTWIAGLINEQVELRL